MSQFPFPTKTWHSTSYPSTTPTPPSQEQTILITGGGSGIGLSISKSLAKAPTRNLIIPGRRTSVLSSAPKAISSLANTNIKVYTIPTDVTNKESIDGSFTEIVAGCKVRYLDDERRQLLRAPSPRHQDACGIEHCVQREHAGSVPRHQRLSASCCAGFNDHQYLVPNGTLALISQLLLYGATKLARYKLLDYVAASNPELRVVNVHPGQVAETETEMAGKGAKRPDLDAHIDDVELAGDFTVWVASGEARFLKGKFV